MNKQQLDTYAFWWSEARLVIAAIALFIGGVPPVLRFAGWLPLVGPLLTLCWILSGVVSAYLLFRWYENKWHVFGSMDQLDMGALAVNIISGFNLGLTGLVGTNIGMSIASNYLVFIVVGVLYIVTAVYLYRRASLRGMRLF